MGATPITERIDPIPPAPQDRLALWVETCGIVLVGLFICHNCERWSFDLGADIATAATLTGVVVQLWRINGIR